MNFISLTFVFLFPNRVDSVLETPVEIQRTLFTCSKLFLLYKGEVLGRRTASSDNGDYLSGRAGHRERQT